MEDKQMSKGFKSTEFWLSFLTALSTILATYNGVIPAKVGIPAAAIVSGIYTIVRGFVKGK